MHSSLLTTHLCAPVTEVVHRDDLPTARLVQVREEGANDGTPQVSDVELLCDVRGRVLDNDAFAGTSGVGAILRLTCCGGVREGVDLIEDEAVEGGSGDNEKEVNAFVADALYPFVGFELRGEIRSIRWRFGRITLTLRRVNPPRGKLGRLVCAGKRAPTTGQERLACCRRIAKEAASEYTPCL